MRMQCRYFFRAVEIYPDATLSATCSITKVAKVIAIKTARRDQQTP